MENKNNPMYRISEFIVDKRKAFYLVFIIAAALSVMAMTKVSVNNDLTSYLPSDTETKRGLDIMDAEFTTYASTKVMVSNITYDRAEKIQERIEGCEGVKSVTFDNDADHYKNSSALYEVTLDEKDGDLDRELEIIDGIKAELKDYDSYFYSETIDDTSKTLDREMGIIMVLAVIVVVGVLLFTSESFMEVPIFMVSFAAGAVINMGTNLILGEISFVTKSVAVVLQLALSIDYSIILSHRFTEEKRAHNPHDAIVAALSKAIVEISSSSLTTVAGLAALIVMRLKIGEDLGIVMCKAIICSLVSVFFLMPGLLYSMSGITDKTRHKNFVPSIMPWCRIVMKARYVLPIVFCVIIAAGAYLSSQCNFVFDATEDVSTRPTEKSIAKDKIEETFGAKHTLAVIVPVGEHDKEKKIVDEAMEIPCIDNVQSLCSTEIEDGYTLTRELTPREFADMMELDYSVCKLLYQAYGIDKELYNAILGDVNDFRVEPIDLLFFMRDCMDKGVIELSEEDEDDLNETFDELDDAKEQLEGPNYARMIFNYTTRVEDPDSKAMANEVREIALKYYPEAYLSSNTTSAMDMESSFSSDNNKINMITILAVLLILLFTFKSAGLPVLLVMSIQGCTWINFSIPYVTREPLHFLGYLVVSSIQMGATIDYAIVITNRYMELRNTKEKLPAAMEALDESFPTVLTSGSILTIAGFLLGIVSTNPMIASLGTVLGRGAFISIIVVLTVLPESLVLCDTLIKKTALNIKKKPEKDSEGKKELRTGLTYVNGRMQGYVSGYVIGEFHGIVRGDINARVESGNMSETTQALLEEKFYGSDGTRESDIVSSIKNALMEELGEINADAAARGGGNEPEEPRSEKENDL